MGDIEDAVYDVQLPEPDFSALDSHENYVPCLPSLSIKQGSVLLKRRSTIHLFSSSISQQK